MPRGSTRTSLPTTSASGSATCRPTSRSSSSARRESCGSRTSLRAGEFIGRSAWEGVCLQHRWRRLAADQLPVRFAQLGRWWNGQDEIDLVGLWGGQTTLVGECKWSGVDLDMRALLDLQRKAEKLPSPRRPLWVLANRAGFAPALRARAKQGDLLLLQPLDLFE